MKSATQQIEGMSIADKNELLFKFGINFNNLPTWQKRGVGVCWTDVEKTGYNPLTNENTQVIRRQLITDFDLPIRDEYTSYIAKRITS